VLPSLSNAYPSSSSWIGETDEAGESQTLEAGELGRDGSWLFGGEGVASLRGSPPKLGRSLFHKGGGRLVSGVHGWLVGGVRYSQIECVNFGCCMAHAANSQA
jgi:hypothetical protein